MEGLGSHELSHDWSVLLDPGARLVALPDWHDPRLLVSADTPAGRWRASAFYPAFRPAARLYRWMLRAKAVSGIGQAYVTAPPSTLSLSDFLVGVLPCARVLAIMLGMPGADRKLVAQLADSTGTVVAYLKCASKPLARQKLRHEYRLLRELPKGVAPVPLKYGSIDGLDALLLAPVEGKPLRPKLPPPPDLRDFTASLATETVRPFQDHPWFRQERGGVPSPVESSYAVLSRRSWPVVHQHGDLAPWNMFRTPERSLTAVDWEDGSSDGLPGLDLAHYLLQVAGLVFRWPAGQARDYVVRYLARDRSIDLSEAEAGAIVTLAAHGAYRHALRCGHRDDDPTQRWRITVWEATG